VPVTIIRHVPFEDIGHIGPILSGRGHDIEYRTLGETLDLGRSDALIIMGGPMSVNDPDPWVSIEIQAIEEAMRRAIPVLGICLGAQLIAKALGQPVTRNPVKEIGWYPIHWRNEAAADPLFHSLHSPETLFHWHGETFGLPEGSVWLAYSERCPHQAFRYGTNIYGLQFHPEVTPEMIADWSRQDQMCAEARELDSPLNPDLNSARQSEVAHLVFGRWADTFLKTQ
jgi:GMP synthase-like glutamine amidotransferase